MSAYLVSDNTIHVLVRGGLQYGLVRRATADLVGQALIEANHWSLVARNGDTMPEWVQYHLPTDVPKIRPEAIYSCVRCYAYQACEMPSWETSGVDAYLTALERRIERSNPGIRQAWEDREAIGPDVFPWGINGAGNEALAPYALPDTTDERN